MEEKILEKLRKKYGNNGGNAREMEKNGEKITKIW